MAGFVEQLAPARVIHRVPDIPYSKGMPLGTLFKADGFPYLAFRIVNNEYVTRLQLKKARALHPGEPVPEIIRDYEERLGRGEIKRPGRPPASLGHNLMVYQARKTYPGLLRYLQICRRRGRVPDGVRTMPVPATGSMHERAAEMVRSRYLPHCSVLHVLNIVGRNSGPFE